MGLLASDGLSAWVKLEGFEEARTKFGDFTSKTMKKAVLRGADIAIHLVISKIRRDLDEREADWSKRRRAKMLIKEYRRLARRMRGAIRSRIGRTLIIEARLGARVPSAPALEYGGKYEQWVETHSRTMKHVFGVPMAPMSVTITEHRHPRTEKAKRYVGRAFDAVRDTFAIPLQRAVEGLLATGEVPKARELRRGLE